MSVRRTGQLRAPGKDRPAGGLVLWLFAILILIGVVHSVLLFRLHQKLDALQSDALPAGPVASALEAETVRESREGRVPDVTKQAEQPPARTTEPEPERVTERDTNPATKPASEVATDWKPLPESARQGIRVQVLNSVGVARLAARAADRLQRLRYDIREKSNAARSLEHTIIIQRGPDPGAAQRLAEDLGIGPEGIRQEADARLVDVDLSLVLGRDYQQLKLFR